MAKIFNPQNEKGEALATTNILNAKIDEVNTKIANLKTLDVTNADDVTEAPISTFANIGNIKFVGRFVNVVQGEGDGIIVYINEDNSLPVWNGSYTESNITESTKFVYDIPSLTGNKAYSYVNKTPGKKDIAIKYTSTNPQFSLSKRDYVFKVEYSINGVSQAALEYPLNEIITGEKPTATATSFSTAVSTDTAFNISYKILGDDVNAEGKTPNTLEIRDFSYVLNTTKINQISSEDDCVVTINKISFSHPLAPAASSKNPYNIIFWKRGGSATVAEPSIKEISTETYKISGLSYISNASWEISDSITGAANGAISSNKVTCEISGNIKVNETAKQESTLSNSYKNQDWSSKRSYTLKAAETPFGKQTFTTSTSIQNPADTNGNESTASSSTRSGTYTIWSKNTSSSTLTEDFNNELNRLTNSYTSWSSEMDLTSNDGLIQNGCLYHLKNNSYISDHFNKMPAAKDSAANESNFYRIFKGSSSKDVTGFTLSFTIKGKTERDSNTTLLNAIDKVEVRVYAYDNVKKIWEPTYWIANKISTPGNNGLAAASLSSDKIKCEFKTSEGGCLPPENQGIRMHLILKDSSIILDKVAVQFIQ